MYDAQKPLDVKTAAEFLGLKVSYIYNLIHFGKLKAYKPSGKKLLFKLSDLEEYAYGNLVGGHGSRADAILNTARGRKKPAAAAKRQGGV
jgi:excisionase family DNA binding protein